MDIQFINKKIENFAKWYFKDRWRVGKKLIWYDWTFVIGLIISFLLIEYWAYKIYPNDLFILLLVFVGYFYGRATIKMAHETLVLAEVNKESLKEAQNERKRPQIVNEVQFVISPLLYKFKEIIRNIEKPYYSWYWEEKNVIIHLSGFPKISSYLYDEEFAERVVYKKYPELKENIEIYNEKIEELEEKFKKVILDIETSDIVELYKQKALEFNKTKDEPYKIHAELNTIDQPITLWILENQKSVKKEPQSNRPVIDFWNAYSKIFLKIREKTGIKEQLDEIDEFMKGLKKSSFKVMDMLNKIREKCREEFNLTEDELTPINPFDRNVKNFL